MKDGNGEFLHRDDVITFNQVAKPRWLTGRHGMVKAFGESRVQIAIEPIIPSDPPKLKRVEPAMVTLGRQRIMPAHFDDPEYISFMNRALESYIEQYLDTAVKQDIISKRQRGDLLELVRSGQ
jgi:hypothetical protein